MKIINKIKLKLSQTYLSLAMLIELQKLSINKNKNIINNTWLKNTKFKLKIK